MHKFTTWCETPFGFSFPFKLIPALNLYPTIDLKAFLMYRNLFGAKLQHKLRAPYSSSCRGLLSTLQPPFGAKLQHKLPIFCSLLPKHASISSPICCSLLPKHISHAWIWLVKSFWQTDRLHTHGMQLYIYRLLVSLKKSLCCCLIFTLDTWAFNTCMLILLVSLKLVLSCCLKFTLLTWIFVLFVSFKIALQCCPVFTLVTRIS